jgi:hypothetical protein
MVKHESDNIVCTKYIFVCPAHFFRQSPLLEAFAKKYAPPAHVVKFIENNKKQIMDLSGEHKEKQSKAFGYLKECPDVYFKGTRVDRLINAERMRSCIEKYNLKLKVVKKYIYNVDGAWIVLADRVDICGDSFCKKSSFKWVYNYLHECIGMFWNTIVSDSKITAYAQQKKKR